MAIVYRMGRRSAFGPDETVLHEVPRVRCMSSHSPPSSTVYGSLPPLWHASLFVTNKRVFVVTYALGVVIQELSSWYPGLAPAGDTELVATVGQGKARLLGNYLEIVTRNEHRSWYWRNICSPDLRLRIGLPEPAPLLATIEGVLSGPGEST